MNGQETLRYTIDLLTDRNNVLEMLINKGCKGKKNEYEMRIDENKRTIEFISLLLED